MLIFNAKNTILIVHTGNHILCSTFYRCLMDSGIVGNSRRLGPKHGTCMALSVSGCLLFWYTECEGGSKQLKEESYLYHERERERERERQTDRETDRERQTDTQIHRETYVLI